MRIALHTWGSEGDIRPFLTLAEYLARRGHDVRLAYSAVDGRSYAERLLGARFAHHDLGAAVSPEALRSLAAEVFADANPLRQLDRVVRELLDPVVDRFTHSAHELAAWADVLVAHMIVHPVFAASERHDKPVVALYTAPMMATRAVPPPGMPNLGPLNGWAWRMALGLLSRKFMPSVARVRAGFELPPVTGVEAQLSRSRARLVAVSPTLFPRPDDWSDDTHVVGFLAPREAPDEAPIDPALEAFLADGPAPVYVTFGSMSAAERHPEQVVQTLAQAASSLGVRAVVQAECAGPPDARLHYLRAAPHHRVFPRCALVVHHGGAGTTQAALRAGRPSVVVAHITDQFMWGRRLEQLGTSPALLTRRGLRADTLARAIDRTLKSETMAARARALGETMGAEDGLAAVATRLEAIGAPPSA